MTTNLTIIDRPSSPEIDAQVTPKGFQSIPLMRWQTLVGDRTELIEPLIYVSGVGERFEIPAGFLTDYASIPKMFRNIYEPTGPARFPAILHDFLYGKLGGAPYYKTRRESDDLFLEAMQLVGVDLAQRRIIYRAVRLFGWLYSGKWSKAGVPKAEAVK